ncbi:MAG: DUF3795 domain-containing protein [Candidatus Aminicenantes bacterium]|nr:DUF3795 domain-containing protein [Candidatus Aminicenantes bacterium]
MSETKLDGYCGLYCGGCDIYRLSEKAKQTGVKAKWEEMPEQFKKVIKEADLVCHGCQSDTVFAGCRICPILKCAKRKGVENCALCAKYPCFLIKMMHIVVRLRKLDKKLPHTAARKPNLEFIRQNGLEKFLSEQELAWKCPQCGARLTWYLEQCACGKGNERYYGGSS